MSLTDGSVATKDLSHAEIRSLAVATLAANGFSDSNAGAIAGCIAEAERDGARSHGLARIPVYVRSHRSGRIDGMARPSIALHGPVQIVVDGDGGFAAPAMALARPTIVTQMASQGMALASFRNSHHLHARWWDVEPLAELGAIAIAFAAARPVMAAFGGTGRAFGTNPIALSCPRAGTTPLTIDMAASAVARGDIGLAARARRRIPLGWALDAAGRPTDDPELALAGTQLPFSESPKASALALMVEIMAVGLSGGSFGFEAARAPTRDDGPLKTGSTVIAFDPSRLGSSDFAARVGALTQHLADSGATRLPGDRRHAQRARYMHDRIPVSAGLVAELEQLRACPAGSP